MKVCQALTLLLALSGCTVLCSEPGQPEHEDQGGAPSEQKAVEQAVQQPTGQDPLTLVVPKREGSLEPKRKRHEGRDKPPRPKKKKSNNEDKDSEKNEQLSNMEKLLKECPDAGKITKLDTLNDSDTKQLLEFCVKSKLPLTREDFWESVRNGHDFILRNQDLFPDVSAAIRRCDWVDIGGKDFLDNNLALYTLERLQEYVRAHSRAEGDHKDLLTVLGHMRHPPGRDYSESHLKIMEIVLSAKESGEEFVTALEKVIAGNPLLIWRAFRYLPGYEGLLLTRDTQIRDLKEENTIREVLESAKKLAIGDFVDDDGKYKKTLVKNIAGAFYRPHDNVCRHIKGAIAEYSVDELQKIIKNIHRKYQIELLAMGRVFDTLLLSDEAIEPREVLSKLRNHLATMPKEIQKALETATFGKEYQQLVRFLDDSEAPISAETLRGLTNALFNFCLGLYWNPQEEFYWKNLIRTLVSHGVVGEALEVQLRALLEDFYFVEPVTKPLADAYKAKGHYPEHMRQVLSVSSNIQRAHMSAIYLQPHIFDVRAITEAYVRDPKEALKMYHEAFNKAINTWASSDALKRRVDSFIELGEQYKLDRMLYYIFRELNTPLEVKAGDAETPQKIEKI